MTIDLTFEMDSKYNMMYMFVCINPDLTKFFFCLLDNFIKIIKEIRLVLHRNKAFCAKLKISEIVTITLFFVR